MLGPYRVRVGLALALTTVACLLNVPVPLLVQGLVDDVIGGGHREFLPIYAVGLLGVCTLQAAFNLSTTLVVGRIGQGVVRDLRHRLYDQLLRLDLAFFDQTPTGSIISRIMDDVTALQTLVTGQTVTILTDLGTTVVVGLLLLFRSGRLTLVVLVFVPLYVVNFRYFMPRIRANSELVRSKMDLIFGHLKEKLDGIVVVKAHATEAAEIKDFGTELADAHISRVRDNRLGVAFSNFSTTISGFGTAAVFAMGAFEVLQGRMTPGGVVSAAALATLLFGPVARLADLAQVFEQAGASIDRLGEILDLEPAVSPPPRPVSITRARGLVEFDRVGFGYRRREPVVWDVRMRVEPGMNVALVGPTGCGKTTLVNLLLRFYDPSFGEIRLDGIPIRNITLADLRRQIGVVLQEPIIFRQPLADNIRYAAPDATDNEMEAAAKAAHVAEFARALPDGYQTLIGEGGHKLSQGERQRVAIARALCKDPALVVLDEATSSLDTAGEAQIQDALRNLLRGRTSIVIAHRLGTVMNADLIVVMDGGLVVQMGTHARLLDDADGLYRRLWERSLAEPGHTMSNWRGEGAVFSDRESVSPGHTEFPTSR